MKKGHVLISTALFLFVGTTIWSAFKEVPRSVYLISQEDEPTAQAPDRVSARSLHFDSEKSAVMHISVPCWVELDDRFSGVEILGDTSLIKGFFVTTNQEDGLVENILIWHKSLEDSPDSMAYPLPDISIRVRIGIGYTATKAPGYRCFTFAQCKKLTTAQPISGNEFDISLIGVDSVRLQLNAEKLTIGDLSIYDETPNRLLQLEGETKQVAINNYTGGTLDASKLLTDDFYLYDVKEAEVRIHARELLRVREMENCNIQVEGNPRFRQIRED